MYKVDRIIALKDEDLENYLNKCITGFVINIFKLDETHYQIIWKYEVK